MTPTEYRELRRRLLRERQLGRLAVEQLTDSALSASQRSEPEPAKPSNLAPVEPIKVGA